MIDLEDIAKLKNMPVGFFRDPEAMEYHAGYMLKVYGMERAEWKVHFGKNHDSQPAPLPAVNSHVDRADASGWTMVSACADGGL